MNTDQRIVQLFDELLKQGDQVSQTHYDRSTPYIAYMGDHGVDEKESHTWGIRCLNLLSRVFGTESDHYIRFAALFADFDDWTPVRKAQGILIGAKADYEAGYLFNVRALIEAEVFDEFLDQADHLQQQGYSGPAAVLAGSVLEDGLRKLCARKGLTLPANPKLDTMNADLAKAGVYNLLNQKRITALAEIRNKAAHGKWSEFTPADVEQMLGQIRTFMTDHFS